jgi:hypothetical protein
MNVLLGGGVRGRGYGDDVDGGQPESDGRSIVDAGGGRTSVNQGEPGLRSRKCDTPRKELLGDILFDAYRDLDDRASLLKRNEGRGFACR